MINFKEYKEKKQKAESDKRAALLDEMAQINAELIETSVLENDGKVNYKLVEKRRREEIQKLTNISL